MHAKNNGKKTASASGKGTGLKIGQHLQFLPKR
jgi:hypothetical protein